MPEIRFSASQQMAIGFVRKEILPKTEDLWVNFRWFTRIEATNIKTVGRPQPRVEEVERQFTFFLGDKELVRIKMTGYRHTPANGSRTTSWVVSSASYRRESGYYGARWFQHEVKKTHPVSLSHAATDD